MLRATFGVGLLTSTDAASGVAIHVAAWLIAVALFVGATTRICCACALACLLWQISHATGLLAPASVFATAVAVALFLLGPGAYSVDGFRYGRRVYRLGP